MNIVDEFVLYDNIEFTKKGWINRNRILVNGKDDYITLPLKKDSDYLHIRDRQMAETWVKERNNMLNRLKGTYSKAPMFKEVFPLIERVVMHEDYNLFIFINNSLESVKQYLDITTKIIISSSIQIDHRLKAEEKVIAICKQLGATTYVNPEGGMNLYSRDQFRRKDIDLKFMKTGNIQYKQFDNEFIPSLSIIDVLMFNSKNEVKDFINNKYILTEN